MQKKRPVPLDMKVKFALANLLLFRKLRGRLGGRLGLFVCGGARLPEEVTRFFHAVGITVLEGYGLTETFAAVTVNRCDDYHFGTVGKPLPGVAVKIASDGEILIKGPNVFTEYLGRPEETAQAFDAEGWFKSGDIGEYSRDGFLRITGRKKEMIVTAGGKNIAPQMIEDVMLSSPLISHFMVHGEGRKFLTALVTLNDSEARDYLRSCGSEVGDGERLAENPAIRKAVEAHIEEKNSKLSKFETIKRFAIIEGDFTVEGGELTPTLKVRRDFTGRKYRESLDALYRD
jgi:long-chain acyl-CoA synthetase